MTPATSPNELIWAGFQDVKEKFIRRIKRSIKIPNTTLVLNWGEYGSGKTHAARFFSKADELEKIATEVGEKSPYSMVIPLPKGKDPIFSIYTSIIDKLDIDGIRIKFSSLNSEINTYIKQIGTNIHIQGVLSAIFNESVNPVLLKKYLYGNLSSAELKGFNDYGILRLLKEDTDYTMLLAGLFSCLTFEKKQHSCVIIWIDEFEDIAVLNSSNIDKTNNFLREILDNTPNNLLVFLNLTQSALFSVEDLGQYVYESVRSRIKERISFDLPSKETFKEYLLDLLSQSRITATNNSDYLPFDETVIDQIIQRIGDVSLRRFNETLSLFIELADMDDKPSPLNAEVYKDYEDEIIWDKQ